jgi:hypothetical protein
MLCCFSVRQASAQSCGDGDINCTYNIWYDSQSAMIKGWVATQYDGFDDWDIYDGADAQAAFLNPDGTLADSDEDNEYDESDYAEADVSADSDGYGVYNLYAYSWVFVYYGEMTDCLDFGYDWLDCYDYLWGDIGEWVLVGAGEPVQPSLDIEPSVEITSADISQDQVVVQLSGVLPDTGALDLRITNTNGQNPVSVIIGGDVVGPGTYTYSFGQETMPLGQYSNISATWTPDNATAHTDYQYDIKVLGVYRQTQYNTPGESDCSGNPSPVTIWNANCTGFDGAIVGGFDFRVTNPQGGTGSGHSIYFGDVQQEQSCSKGSGDLRGCSKIKGSLGSLSDSTIAVCPRDTNSTSDMYVSGRQVYIKGQGMKTVTDACPACCSDPVQADNHAHFDNYTTDTSCSGIPSLPNAWSVIVY